MRLMGSLMWVDGIGTKCDSDESSCDSLLMG